jgi:glycosyltransferase involved in cell wall biosynthesis
VYDYVDLEHFQADQFNSGRVDELRQHYKPRGEQLAVFLGMFKDYQGVDYLIRAFAELAPHYPDLRLMLIGDGPCRAQYEQIIRTAGIGGKVIMPGLIPHRDVVYWLQIADIVVSPRIDNEITKAGFVSQMPEYMAAGRLIVATPVSGCGYLLRDGAGIIVGANDVEALRAGLEKALRLRVEEKAGYVANARRNVAPFTWQNGIHDVYRVYRSLLPQRTG